VGCVGAGVRAARCALPGRSAALEVARAGVGGAPLVGRAAFPAGVVAVAGSRRLPPEASKPVTQVATELAAAPGPTACGMSPSVTRRPYRRGRFPLGLDPSRLASLRGALPRPWVRRDGDRRASQAFGGSGQPRLRTASRFNTGHSKLKYGFHNVTGVGGEKESLAAVDMGP
jgi:hypothetical protein